MTEIDFTPFGLLLPLVEEKFIQKEEAIHFAELFHNKGEMTDNEYRLIMLKIKEMYE